MKKIKLFTLMYASLAFLLCITLHAQDEKTAPIKDSVATKPKEVKFITHHTITIDGKSINYTATVGTVILKNEKDEPTASIGYTYYAKDKITNYDQRPVTFSYNGGPGSSSMWLHMGIMGPKRVVVNDPNDNLPPPYKTVDNQFSILDVSDIVMIDPVGTGISKALNKSTNKDFWSVNGDISSLSNFIQSFITENDRWNSPKYLLGESYGTFRSAGIANYLQENLGIVVNGIVLVSTVLDLRTISFQSGDDISYVLHLPTYAATAWYHNKLINKPPQLETFLKSVRQFANGEYATALAKGSTIDENEKNSIAEKLASFTGISKEYILNADLRINEPQFTQELMRKEHLTLGRLDSRYKGINQNPLSEMSNYDPQSSSIAPAYVAAFLNYYYTELKVSKDLTYKTSAYTAPDFNWDWKHNPTDFGDPSSPTTATDLANAMVHNPNLKILLLNGYYDLATPFYATEYTFDHLKIDKKLKSNLSYKYYSAGHMMYVDPVSAKDFKKDVAEFIAQNYTH